MESGQVYFNIRRHNHHIGLGNVFGGQRVAGAHRASGFHLDLITEALCFCLERLGRHKGVGDAGGAGGDGDKTMTPARRFGGGRRIHQGVQY